MSTGLDFDEAGLPWVDRPDFEDQLNRALTAKTVSAEESEWLRHWQKNGFMVFRSLIPETLIDAAWVDYYRAFEDRPVCKALLEGKGVIWLSEMPAADEVGASTNFHFRFMDFHNVSAATKLISMDPTVMRFLQLVLRDTPVAMQTLAFEFGSEPGVASGLPLCRSQTPQPSGGGMGRL